MSRNAKRKTALAAGAIALAAAALTLPASAGEHTPPPPQPPQPPRAAMHGHGFGQHGPGSAMHHLRMLAYRLEFTEQQREQAREIVEDAMEGPLGEATRAMRDARHALGRAVHDPQAAPQQVSDAVRRLAEIEERVALGRHEIAVAIDGILTEEQRERFAVLHEEMSELPRPPAPPHRHRAPHAARGQGY